MKNQSVAKRCLSGSYTAGIAKYKDLSFPVRSSDANYNGVLGPDLNSSELYINDFEKSVLAVLKSPWASKKLFLFRKDRSDQTKGITNFLQYEKNT